MADNDARDDRPGWQKRLNLELDAPVFFISVGIIGAMVVLTILFDAAAGNLLGAVQAGIANYTGWLFVIIINLVLGFIVYLLFTRFATIRLGGKDAEPEFSLFGWFAMLFSAGMGIGLLFYGVAEPMFHFAQPPLAEPESLAAAQDAMQFTFLHWGFHPWAVYALVGLALAFFSFNRGMPLTIRSVFHPLLGDRIHGWPGVVIDVLATIATLFGVATSLGVGVQQVNGGLEHLFGIAMSATTQLILIAVITGFATYSVVRGLKAGIQRISQLNILAALMLMLFVIVLGPTLFILNALPENIGMYMQNLPFLASWDETYTRTDWQNGWTVFYWGWWIAWSPFVGMFIARVSYGRTVRDFILGVLLVPTFACFVWFTVFGDTALFIELFGGGGIVEAVEENIAVSLFVFLEHLPLATVTSIVGMLVVVSFFVTSSDSGSLVIDIITSGGDPEPPVAQRVFWAVTEGAVAGALLVGGGLVALQTAAISTGLPFAIVLLLMGWSLLKGMRRYVERHPLATESPLEAATYRARRRRGRGSSSGGGSDTQAP